jgi:hypothetical protein
VCYARREQALPAISAFARALEIDPPDSAAADCLRELQR